MKVFTLFFLLFVCLLATQTFAATFTVTRIDDRNETCNSGVDCSLREAVTAANATLADDLINFSADLTLITLTNEIAILNRGTLTIGGNGANVFSIDAGGGANRIFYTFGATVIISGMTLTNGNGTSGGAIYAVSGSLTLDRVHLLGNKASSSGSGVFFNDGTHRITNSTFSGNTAASACAIFNDGRSTLIVVNSIISGNTGLGTGGFCNYSGNTKLRNVTITNNTGVSVGGITIFLGSLDFGNTIVAGNIATGSANSEFLYANTTGTAITSAGNNLVGDSPGDSTNTGRGIPYQLTDLRDVNPMLGTLQNYGGTTPTHSLLTGSPAINAGNNTDAPTTDQRGFARIIGGTIDIGAYEFAPVKSRKRVRFF